MILNDKQFRDKVQKAGSKCIFFYEGHGTLDHNDPTVRPFERLGGGKNENLSTAELLTKLDEFSKLYPDAYSVYIHTAAQAITQKGFFMKIDLRLKEEKTSSNPSSSQPAVDVDKIKKEVRKEIEMENQVENLTEELKESKDIIAHDNLVANKMAKVGLEMLKEFGFMQEAAPMQGTETGTSKNVDESLKYLQSKLGDKFIITLAEKIKADPSLAERLKIML